MHHVLDAQTSSNWWCKAVRPPTFLTLLTFLGLVALSGCSSGDAASPAANAGAPNQIVDPSQWSGLTARLTMASARFEFRYAKPDETLYKVHLSSTPDFSWDDYFNFTAGAASPLVQDGPHEVWSAYDCGAALYWRVEAVATGGVNSGIQGPATVEC
jgi:hypothetical protein